MDKKDPIVYYLKILLHEVLIFKNLITNF